MSLKNTSERYGALSIGMHWLMVVLIVGVYVCMDLHEFFPKGSDTRNALITGHFMLGLSVLALVWLRLLLRLMQMTPVITPTPNRLQQGLATALHWILYAFMFAMPILGWLILSAAGKPIPFWGLHLPALIAQNKDTAHQMGEIHETIGNIGYFLIGLHTVAALFHHYWQKDNTLLRMLPGRK